MLTVTMQWIQGLVYQFSTVFVQSSPEAMAKSLVHHKKLNPEFALECSNWYYNKLAFFMYVPHIPVHFSSNQEQYQVQLRQAIFELGLVWNQELFNANWNNDLITTYEKK